MVLPFPSPGAGPCLSWPPRPFEDTPLQIAHKDAKNLENSNQNTLDRRERISSDIRGKARSQLDSQGY
jgi:hypothetical protein